MLVPLLTWGSSVALSVLVVGLDVEVGAKWYLDDVWIYDLRYTKTSADGIPLRVTRFGAIIR
jgi:hypothetical protein